MPVLLERGLFRRRPVRTFLVAVLILLILYKSFSIRTDHIESLSKDPGITLSETSGTPVAEDLKKNADAAIVSLAAAAAGLSTKDADEPQKVEKVVERGNALVVASLKGDDVEWLKDVQPGWEKNIYVANDDGEKALRIPKNKGRESMVYLSFIIDNYDRLPNVTVFLHSQRYQWHNDDPLYDGLPLLQSLQLSHIHSQGYANLRCCWVLGCPVEMRPNREKEDPARGASVKATEDAYSKAFMELFPGDPVPNEVGVGCCAQFAATRTQIRTRPLSDYTRYRTWLLSTRLPDDVSGRIMEYSWHMIFGKPAVHCPLVKECYCKTFGYCNLTCTDGQCDGRYTLPKYSTLPVGWPEIGWDGKKGPGAVG